MKELGHRWIDTAVARPRAITWIMAISTLVLVVLAVGPTLIPGGVGPLHTINVDADPENMLDANEPVRVQHHERKQAFGLHDGIVLGVVNEKNANGVFNVATLGKVYRLTELAKTLEGVVAQDVMAISTVDSIENAGPGTVKFDWLMPAPPANEAEASAVRERAERLPFLRDTLFSADGKAMAIYVPLEDKTFAHEVSQKLHAAIGQLEGGNDEFHIAGIPVAEDTFGVEMFKQMAISAPLAMLVIFLLMWAFFKRLIVIVSPMIVAMVAAITTMALLVITGNTIHIMSSMIPIFIMPIAVLDAVHIISDFFDRYEEGADRRTTVVSVMRHLFTPMLFTSLTTTAGFASLALTPIPPVRVFGIFVALGVVAAWFWTIVFIPAFLMLVPERMLKGFGRIAHGRPDEPSLGILAWLSRFTFRRAKLIVVGAVAVTGIAAFGITKINVNDNPTRWFEADHPIRVADRVMNRHFGGTYDAFLSFDYEVPTYSANAYAETMRQRVTAESKALDGAYAQLIAALKGAPKDDMLDIIDAADARLRSARKSTIDATKIAALGVASDFLASQFSNAEESIDAGEALPAAKDAKTALDVAAHASLAANQAQLKKLTGIIATVTSTPPISAKAFRAAVNADIGPDNRVAAGLVARLAQSNDVFKQPELLAYIEKLQRHLATSRIVGKSSSVVDIVKTVHRDLVSGNEADYRIPGTRAMVAQSLEQYLSSHRKDDLWHFVTPDYKRTVIWVQLKSGDNADMEKVVADVEKYVKGHPAPVSLSQPRWFGLTYINVVWQDKMVTGMMKAFIGSFVIVLLMMVVLFRSLWWGLLSMIPLTLTVGLIYGVTGLVGKDYDMPVAVLSSLSLGLAVDYAIHFLARARQLVELHGSWAAARTIVFGEPARAISRNVVVVGFGFLPLLLAPLLPYRTVGILIASILILAGAATLVLLPALLSLSGRILFPSKNPVPHAVANTAGTADANSR